MNNYEDITLCLKTELWPVTETENHIFCEKSLFGYVYIKLFDIKWSI